MALESSYDDIDAAVRVEQDAYQLMRELIPDLALPAGRRLPLDRRQQAAVRDYEQARERLRLARDGAKRAHRVCAGPGR